MIVREIERKDWNKETKRRWNKKQTEMSDGREIMGNDGERERERERERNGRYTKIQQTKAERQRDTTETKKQRTKKEKVNVEKRATTDRQKYEME